MGNFSFSEFWGLSQQNDVCLPALSPLAPGAPLLAVASCFDYGKMKDPKGKALLWFIGIVPFQNKALIIPEQLGQSLGRISQISRSEIFFDV